MLALRLHGRLERVNGDEDHAEEGACDRRKGRLERRGKLVEEADKIRGVSEGPPMILGRCVDWTYGFDASRARIPALAAVSPKRAIGPWISAGSRP